MLGISSLFIACLVAPVEDPGSATQALGLNPTPVTETVHPVVTNATSSATNSSDATETESSIEDDNRLAFEPVPKLDLPELIQTSQSNPTAESDTGFRFRGPMANDSNAGFQDVFFPKESSVDVGVDFYSAPDFIDGLIIEGRGITSKIGGYIKGDLIYDLNPIDNTDTFDTTSIPVGAPSRTNSRFHARQTRLSLDTRWSTARRPVRVFVEGDFFSDQDQFRLRHAYGEVGPLLVGQKWTTFTDVAAAPATLDFEGAVSTVNRRQAQVRWTEPILDDALTLAVAVEDTRFIIEAPPGVTGDARSPSPDFIARLRLQEDWGQFQIAGLYRLGGFQPTGMSVEVGSAWGVNLTGVIPLSEDDKVYYQIIAGEGIGSYRGLPDATPDSLTTSKLLGLFGWMVGLTHEWNDDFSSNFTYAENSLDVSSFQDPSDVRRTTYLAANVIWSPLERVKVGVEYLYGLRENVDKRVGVANRLQSSIIFELP